MIVDHDGGHITDSIHYTGGKVSISRKMIKSFVEPYGKCLEAGKTTKSLEYGKCLETGKQQKSFVRENCSGQGAPNGLEYGRGVTEYGKCLETGKRQNPLLMENCSGQGAPNDLEYGRGGH